MTKGRRNEFSRFARSDSCSAPEAIPDPNANETFFRSKLDWGCLTQDEHAGWLNFYRKLLSIRKREVVPRLSALSVTRCESSGSASGSLSIDWVHPDGSLIELRANLSNEWHPAAQHSGEIFYCGSPEPSEPPESSESLNPGPLPPWSVRWALRK